MILGTERPALFPLHRYVVLAAVGLGLLTGISRVPFRSRYLFSWDAANFALALEQYNVAFHQPQPPGYILFVGAAWLLHLLVPDANAAYVWLSVAASGVSVALCALVGARLFGAHVGFLGAALLAGSSVFWGQGVVAYPYAFLALFTSLAALLALETKWGRRDLSVPLAAVIGVGGGFRPDLVPFLLPLWVYASYRRWWPNASGHGDTATRRHGDTARSASGSPIPPLAHSPTRSVPAPLRGAALGLLTLAAAVAAWYVPTVLLSGGWAPYQKASTEYYGAILGKTSGYGKLLLAILENVRTLTTYLYNGLGLALLPMLYFAGRFFAPQQLVLDRRPRFLLVWLLPPLAFYVVAHLGNPGYVLSFLPALCLYAGVATVAVVNDLRETLALSPISNLQSLISGRAAAVASTGLVLLFAGTSTLLFLFATGEGRNREIRDVDRILGQQIAYIRANHPPDQTVILAFDRSRQLRYYLREYRIDLLFTELVAGLGYDESRYWEKRRELAVPPGVNAVLFPDLGRNTSDQPGSLVRRDLGQGVSVYVAAVRQGDVVRYGYQYAAIGR